MKFKLLLAKLLASDAVDVDYLKICDDTGKPFRCAVVLGNTLYLSHLKVTDAAAFDLAVEDPEVQP